MTPAAKAKPIPAPAVIIKKRLIPAKAVGGTSSITGACAIA